MIEQDKYIKEVLLSEGKKATAEAEIEGHEATKAIDGMNDTFWAAAPYYKWWKIDLEKCCHITRIVIDNGDIRECYYHYLIEYSKDNLNWETAVDKHDNMYPVSGGDIYEVSFVARYIRVTMTYCSLNDIVQIKNFRVYGNPMVDDPEEKRIIKKSPAKIYAANCDFKYGFSEITVTDIEPESEEKVLIGKDAGAYIVFKDVYFSDLGVNQIRGCFGFTDKDKTKCITMEVRLDDLHGEKIGELVLFKQYTIWSELAGRIEHANQKPLTGIHDVYLIVTKSSDTQCLMIHWISFIKKSPLPVPKALSDPLPPLQNDDYNIYFGNLHSHTCLSDGEGTPDEAYDYARYVAGLDFLAITEHTNLFDNCFDWDKSRKWADLKRISKEKTEEGVFLALYGSETTWYNQFGHMNIYNAEFFLNAYELEYNHIPNYYETIKQYTDSINQWNHPWSCGDRQLDGFEPYDPELDKVLYLLEVESEKLGGLSYYISALDKGWHLAPVGSQDNHKKQWGTESNLRTAVLLEKLTTEHLFDAIKHYRVYFTTAIHLKVWFRINGYIMGSRLKRADYYLFQVKAVNTPMDSPIVKVEVIGEHGTVRHTVLTNGYQLECTFSLSSQDKYYFIKISQEDGEYAATAPIWIENE